MEKQVWLIRHPEVEDAYPQRFVGFHDAGLSVQGIQQAECLAEFLQRQNLERIISTGLERTDYLARMIAQAANIAWEVEPSLKEMHFGRWDGLSAKEVQEAEPELYEACVRADMNFRFPEGESIQEFFDRIKSGLDKVIKETDDEVVVVITHGGVVRMALIDLLELDFQSNWRFCIDYGSLSVLEIYGDYTRIGKINDTCHLDGITHRNYK